MKSRDEGELTDNKEDLDWGLTMITIKSPAKHDSLLAQQERILLLMQQTQGPLPGWEDPLEGEVQPTPVSLPRESHGQRGLVGYSPQGRKVRQIRNESNNNKPDYGDSLAAPWLTPHSQCRRPGFHAWSRN